MRLLHAVALLLFASPGVANAATLTTRDVPLRGERQLSLSAPPFTMVGLHWQGPGAVEFRTRGVEGGWSAWRPAAPEDEDRPDRTSSERTAPGWRVGNAYWSGPSDRLEVRTRGRVTRVRAHYVDSPAARVPPRTISLASSPAIIPRLSWGANESIRRGGPYFAGAVQFAIVHHTAGSNSYSKEESAAIVRGIQLYHVQGNGWNDIGYNFLVDKYGQVFEGRYGGMDRDVVGAHAEGFNTGSVGVAVLGSYGSATISSAARASLVRLLAWRLDLDHVDATSTLTWTSGGNDRYPRGVPVFLRAVAAHSDTGFTACPGAALYEQLGDLAGRTSRTGLPKLYAPEAAGGVGGPVRFTGQLSAELPWTVTVSDSLGNRVATGSGTGAAVDWTWDATGAAPGSYLWTIEAGPDVRPAQGTIGRPAALALTQVKAEPAVVSPNGDGHDDSASISYFLTRPATVTATVGELTLFSEAKPAGEHRFDFAAENFSDGAYTISLHARNGGEVSTTVPLTVNRTLGYLGSPQPLVSPNGDGRLDTLTAGFLLGAPSDVRVRIVRNGKWVATVFRGELGAGQQALTWDGRKPHGRLRDGAYELEVTATSGLGSVSQRTPVTVDTQGPELRLLSIQRVRVRVNEPGRLVVNLNGRWRTIDRTRAGVALIPRPAVVRKLRVVMRDLAGNASAPLMYP